MAVRGFGPPNVISEPRKNRACYQPVSCYHELPPLPTVSKQLRTDNLNRRTLAQKAEVEGVISGSPDACICPYTAGAGGKEPARLVLKAACYHV